MGAEVRVQAVTDPDGCLAVGCREPWAQEVRFTAKATATDYEQPVHVWIRFCREHADGLGLTVGSGV